MTRTQVRNVLFLCTGNSARSIMAEAILNHFGGGAWRGFSAGSKPSGAVRPEAMEQLRKVGISTEGLRSKSWVEFAATDAPLMEFTITVCDNAANEACPFWPGHPALAHWGLPDPASAKGDPEAVSLAFAQAFGVLERRIRRFVDLPLETLSGDALRLEMAMIGGIA